jgi:isopenicillin-N epimerase
MNDWVRHWMLDPQVVFLNHGSFGATPRAVLARQQQLREQLEAEPVAFLAREHWHLIDAARERLAAFLGATPANLVFVNNATAGVNAVLRSLRFQPGDELLTTDHEYGASAKALRFVAQRWGAQVRVAQLPFPGATREAALDAILAAVTPRTRLVLVDHVTSASALVLPIEELARQLARREILVLVDGAHAPGMIPLALDRLAEAGVAYYTANCHKWLCAPKGAALLYVRADRQPELHPLAISHGYGVECTRRSAFQLEFDWTGTADPTAWFCIPESLDCLGAMLPGGWPAVMEYNRHLALRGRDLLCAALGCQPPAEDAMLGSMATIPLPPSPHQPPQTPFDEDPLQHDLLQRYGIEVPIILWPQHPRRWVRISAQLYNEEHQLQMLADALRRLLAEGR